MEKPCVSRELPAHDSPPFLTRPRAWPHCSGRGPRVRRATAHRGQRRASAGRVRVVRRHRHCDRFLDESATRKRGTFRTVGFSSVRNGDFDITTRPTPLLRRTAARNGGSVNLLLLVKTEAGKAVLPFTRKLANRRCIARSSASPRLLLHPWDKGSTSTKALASQERSDCEWRRSRNYNATRAWDSSTSGVASARHSTTRPGPRRTRRSEGRCPTVAAASPPAARPRSRRRGSASAARSSGRPDRRVLALRPDALRVLQLLPGRRRLQ
jgi:hypothetical protein